MDRIVRFLRSIRRREGKSAPGPRVLTLLFILGASLVVLAVSARVSRAVTTAQLKVNPPVQSELWYRPTPMTFTVDASSLSGTGVTPVTAYEYALTWDPLVLKWLSGPRVGPGTPTPAPVLPCTNSPQIITWGTATSTPIGFVPTFTPTPTSTPLTTTPTATFSSTFTATPTPTPGGYIKIGCGSISGTAVASGRLGTFTFQPIALGQVASAIKLVDVLLVNVNATPVAFTSANAKAQLLKCNDLNGDYMINALDLNILAHHFLTMVGNPNYLLVADLNQDGAINALDLNLLAATFLVIC